MVVDTCVSLVRWQQGVQTVSGWVGSCLLASSGLCTGIAPRWYHRCHEITNGDTIFYHSLQSLPVLEPAQTFFLIGALKGLFGAQCTISTSASVLWGLLKYNTRYASLSRDSLAWTPRSRITLSQIKFAPVPVCTEVNRDQSKKATPYLWQQRNHSPAISGPWKELNIFICHVPFLTYFLCCEPRAVVGAWGISSDRVDITGVRLSVFLSA